MVTGPRSREAGLRPGAASRGTNQTGVRLYNERLVLSLIRRHREDDPSDRAVGLMTAVGSANLRGNPSASGGSTPHDSTSDSGDKDSNNNTTPSAPTSFDDCMAAGLGLGYCFGLFPNG